MASLNHLGILTGEDVAIQIAPCSFDVHVQECLGSLMLGCSLVLLHPQGHLDVDYLSQAIEENDVTLFCIVPSHMAILSNYLAETDRYCRLRSVRKFGFLGNCTRFPSLMMKTCGSISLHSSSRRSGSSKDTGNDCRKPGH